MSVSSREKKIFAIFALVVAIFLFIAPYIIIPKAYAGREDWINTAPPNAVFLELWQIDTFEGGSSSRARFLEKNAFLYQEQTINTYVLVRSFDVNQAKLMLEQGSRPDIISFGIGAGDFVLPISEEITTDCGVRADLLAGGMKEGKQYAIPWTMGGYCLCANSTFGDLNLENFNQASEQQERAVIGTGYTYNVPKLSLTNDERKFVTSESENSQYQAYENFLKGNEFQVLLGTQRDFYRLNNKVELGVIDGINYRYLSGYTDLIQYMSVTTANENLIAPATKFIKFITSSKIQAKLTSIGMFSVNGEKIYKNEYVDFENALNEKMQVLNVFTPLVHIKEIQQN